MIKDEHAEVNVNWPCGWRGIILGCHPRRSDIRGGEVTPSGIVREIRA